MVKKDSQTPQTGIDLEKALAEGKKLHRKLLTGISDTSHCQQQMLPLLYLTAMTKLHRIFEVLPDELVVFQDDLSTSFVAAETEIARCMSLFLSDAPEQNRDIEYIRSLLRDYKVFVPLRVQGKNPTVSLSRIHLLLQDNFQDSCLCSFFNILLTGFMNVETKIIDF